MSRPPGLLWLGVAAYLASLPFLPPRPGALALVALVLCFAATGLRHRALIFSDLWPVLPFLAVGGLAALRAKDPVLAAGFFSFQLPGLIVFLLTVTDRSIDPRGWMRLWALFALEIACTVLAGRLCLALGGETLFGEDVPQASLRLSGNLLLAVPNDVCTVTLLAAFPLGLLAGGAGRIERALALITLGASLLAASLVRSRTGLLIEGVEIAMASLLWPGLRRIILPFVLVAALAVPWFASAALHKFAITDLHDLHGIAGRLGLWVAAWRMFLAAPLLGHGALSFGPDHFAFLPHWAPQYPEGRAPWAHDLFLDILAEQGALGGAAFLCLVVPPIRGAWRAARAATCRQESQIALCALTGFAIAGCLELSLIRRIVPLLLFGLLGFAARCAATHRTSPCAVDRANRTT